MRCAVVGCGVGIKWRPDGQVSAGSETHAEQRSWIFPTPELQRHPNAHTLIGLGVSPGKVTAVARVIHSLDEMDKLNPGEILVAHTTTPAWTPLFTRISGLITDLGGPLAHGSIVAREVGIPAVMGTGSATHRIRSGQQVTILGSEGKIILD